MAKTKEGIDLPALREVLAKVDAAIHRSMPPGGNANHEEAQRLIGELLRQLKEES